MSTLHELVSEKSRRCPAGLQASMPDPEMGFSMYLYNLPRVSMKDADAVERRVHEYMDACCVFRVLPGAVSLALALGTSRQNLYNYRTGRYKGHCTDPAVIVIIKRMWGVLEASWEAMMQSGGVNPASGIFIGKNCFEYKDVVEETFVLSGNEGITAPEALMNRLEALPK